VLEVVGVLPDTGETVVVAGLGRSSNWFRNIQAEPALCVEIGRERFIPAQRVLDPVEAGEVMAAYERRNRLAAPIVRVVLSRLLGWPYDGAAEARARLTRQLPFVAFRPFAPPGTQSAGRRIGAAGEARLTMAIEEVAAKVHLVELRGDLDIDSFATVLADVSRYVTAHSTVVLDAAGIEFLDSGGLHTLIVLAHIARTRGANLRLAAPAPAVEQMLERTGANRVIDVRTRVADAIEH
jgi:anti-anti-sigma factor